LVQGAPVSIIPHILDEAGSGITDKTFFVGSNRGYMNHWGIPAWLDDEVRKRDKTCIYCGVEMLEKVRELKRISSMVAV